MAVLDRVLSLLGLELDLSFSLARDPFNEITHDVFLGARPGREQVDALAEAGVTHVVSCLPEDHRASVGFLKNTFESLFVPMHDGVREDIESSFPVVFDFVQAAAQQRDDAKVFVHCEVGVSRSATLVIALLMHRHRKRFFETYQAVRAKRAEVLPNIGFASQLQRLELRIHPEAPQDVSSLARYLKEVCMAPVDVETLQHELHRHDYDALGALQAIFADEIPRVIQGVRL